MMWSLILTALLVAILGYDHVGAANCVKRDTIVVLEVKPGSSIDAYYATKFMKNMKNKFNPSANCQRIGFIFVWSTAQSVVELGCTTARCFSRGENTANIITQRTGQLPAIFNKKLLAQGMKLAHLQFTRYFRAEAEKVLVLVVSNAPSSSAPKTEDEVKDFLDMGVEVIAVGVGKGVEEKLSDIASKDTYVLEFPAFKALSSPDDGAGMIHLLLNTAKDSRMGKITSSAEIKSEEMRMEKLKEDGKSACENIVDIAFIVDSSGSVRKYYKQEKFFVQRIASRFQIIESGTHGGVIIFSSHGYIKTMIRFYDYLTTDSFNEAVENLPFYGYLTRIDKALQLAHKELYTEAGRTRPNVKKLLFLITDGKQNPDSVGGKRLDPAREAEKLHLSNVQVYAVGIGSKVNKTELELITKDPAKVYSATDFEELTSDAFVTKVSKQLCKAATQVKNETTITFNKTEGCDNKSCKCGGCGCCGNKPVYVNIFQGGNSRNYVNQGQTVVQSGSGNSAGATGSSTPLSGGQLKGMSNQEIVNYVKKLIPYYDSLNGGMKELLTRTIINRRKRRNAELQAKK